jgi:hypothetical protein
MQLKNAAAGNRWFTASDFKVGQEITLNKFTFITSEADDYAMSYMEGDTDAFTQSDLFQLIQGFRKDAAKIEEIRKLLQSVDPELKGYTS